MQGRRRVGRREGKREGVNEDTRSPWHSFPALSKVVSTTDAIHWVRCSENEDNPVSAQNSTMRLVSRTQRR